MPSPAALVRSLLATLVLLVGSVAGYNGQGTAYGHAGGRGSGACGIRENLGRYETYYAAMNEAQYGGSCRKCINVCGKGGCVKVMIVDKCPGRYCKHGDVDMSSNALKAATGYSWDRKPISWTWTSCGGDDSRSSTSKKCKCKGKKGSSLRKCKKKCRN